MFVRFIYCLRRRGLPVYVGSSFKPTRRFATHRYGGKLPIDRLIARERNAFTLEILEAFRTKTFVDCMELSVARENQWIDVLGTWWECGGQNHSRASVTFTSEEQHSALSNAKKAAWANSAIREQRVAVQNSPKTKALRSAACCASWTRPESRERRVLAAKAAWARRKAAAAVQALADTRLAGLPVSCVVCGKSILDCKCFDGYV